MLRPAKFGCFFEAPGGQGLGPTMGLYMVELLEHGLQTGQTLSPRFLRKPIYTPRNHRNKTRASYEVCRLYGYPLVEGVLETVLCFEGNSGKLQHLKAIRSKEFDSEANSDGYTAKTSFGAGNLQKEVLGEGLLRCAT